MVLWISWKPGVNFRDTGLLAMSRQPRARRESVAGPTRVLSQDASRDLPGAQHQGPVTLLAGMQTAQASTARVEPFVFLSRQRHCDDGDAGLGPE